MGWLSVLEIFLVFFVRPVLIIQFGHSLTIVMESKEEGLILGVVA